MVSAHDPRVAPRAVLDLAAVLERHAADDQGHEHEQQGEVEGGEPGRVPVGEGGEDAAPATISHTSLPSQNGPIVLMATRRSSVGLADEHVQHADAEVEALEDEEPDPEDGDDDEPE